MATQPIEAQTVPDAVIDAEIDEPQTQAQERDYETEARRQGWKPAEEFEEGEKRPSVFKDAETFVLNNESIAGFQKKTIARMAAEVQYLKRAVKHLTKSEQNAYANAMADLEAKQDAAVEMGDVAEAKRLRAEAKALTDAKADPMRGENPVEELATFREENAWFDRANLASASDDEKEARRYADIIADKWIGQGLPNQIPPSEFYSRLADAVKAKFPALGRKVAAPKPPSDVAGVTQRTTAKASVTLSREEMDQAERYMRQKIPGFKDCKTKQEAHQLFAKLGEQ